MRDEILKMETYFLEPKALLLDVGSNQPSRFEMAKSELRARCIELRVSQRLSLKEIAHLTGAAPGSLSAWLKPYPLTAEEQKAKTESARERDRALGKVWGNPKKQRNPTSKMAAAVLPGLGRTAKGTACELAVNLRLIMQGFETYSPSLSNSRDDLVVKVPGTRKFASLQIKWARANRNGLPTICLLRTHGHGVQRPYEVGEFDFIVGYHLESDTAYVFAGREVSSFKSTITVRPDAAERWDKILAFGQDAPVTPA